ncbi:lmo0954 family membrane protein [Thermaerobacillus caldiproteolyticus]|uniref:Lia operon protein LiaI n=1 Tax=Thermaerobacillus caldiproteolyticus TaxID=247480 RepID=A0A7W0BXV3_9BACL|nr:flagellar basal body rod protein [Anoxybacillus caldiproteolyticus]MBA2874388.1 lia operon protein LiaI [Anoxybacillus caldiproteolyticus]QPA30906.1 flagellar basal body rod protein [Anoxybacillus caldiproteolyticus]
MKKCALLVAGGVAAIVLVANLGSIVGLAISLVIMYYAFKKFVQAKTVVKKVFWAVLGLIALSAAASNVPAIIGVAAAYVLYIVYKKWNKHKPIMEPVDDPFINFEKQWAELKRNY